MQGDCRTCCAAVALTAAGLHQQSAASSNRTTADTWARLVLQMSLRYTLDEWIMGEDAPASARRSLLETAGILLTALPVALLFPTASEKVFAVTGASAVCMVCYVCPVAIHLLLLLRQPPPAVHQLVAGADQLQHCGQLILGQGEDDGDRL